MDTRFRISQTGRLVLGAANSIMVALSVLAAPALGAQHVGVSGDWTVTYCPPSRSPAGQQTCREGSPRSVSMDATLEQDGTTVTGTAFISPRWPERVGEPEPVPLSDVSLDGDEITFTVTSTSGGLTIRYVYTGTLTGDTMEGTMTIHNPVSPGPLGPFPFKGARKGGSGAAAQNSSRLTTEALIKILSADQRLDALSAEHRTRTLEEAARWGTHCESNPTLGAQYDCACFARGMLDARFEVGFEVEEPVAKRPRAPVGWPDLQPYLTRPQPDCVSREKLTAYTERMVDGMTLGKNADEVAKAKPCIVEAVLQRYQSGSGTRIDGRYRPPVPTAMAGTLTQVVQDAYLKCIER